MTYSIPYTMIPGTKARAQEVNANFKYVTDSLDELASKKMNTTLTNLTSEAIEVIKNLTSIRNIGETVLSSIPLTDAGLHLLDGSLLQYGIYKEFIDYIADLYTENPNANYFCTESQWQASVTQYGVCGKFVYDSTNNTVRLPKITGIIEGTTDVNALGDLVEAGLPNITGEVQPHYDYWRMGTWEGYNNFTTPGTAAWGSGAFGNSTNTGGISFDASRSNSIYGNSTTVQPQTIKCFVYIVIANSTKTDIQVDIDNVATDLNGKADRDLSNTTPAISFATALDDVGIRTVVETYQNGTSWYRVYSDGWCEQGGKFVITTASISSGGYNKATLTFLKPFNKCITYNVQAKHDRFNGGFETDINGQALSQVNVYQVNDSGGSFANPYVIWQASGYIR